MIHTHTKEHLNDINVQQSTKTVITTKTYLAQKWSQNCFTNIQKEKKIFQIGKFNVKGKNVVINIYILSSYTVRLQCSFIFFFKFKILLFQFILRRQTKHADIRISKKESNNNLRIL